MYNLDLTGFLKSKRIICKTIEEARAAWLKARDETYTVTSFGDTHEAQFSLWDLFLNNEIVASGIFERN